ncbi:hypothetical protein CP556_23045 [Natrinema sp. CBA1119]|uniref:hypothetical protein n=1 Tax=Natrinema sp. CBA1119 TaxID=1608465 RepID=UPI000BF97CFD|nr:hypothetical protein [Natrinema sp. CBA1119]PGF13961.1 hypothetical protein CP556_23045 [Natrinema sp. CBA1119]
MTCPYLSYRQSAGDQEFETERAYCGVVEEFVSPMRADVCNDRHELNHERDCEFYRDAESE